MKIRFGGGLNENDGTQPHECQTGKNFDLILGDSNFTPRKPLDLKDTLTQSGACNGIMQLIKKDDTETTIVFEAAAIPTLYLWTGDTLTSVRTASLDVTSKLRSSYWALDEYLVITDLLKATPLLKWDGVACSRIDTGIASTNVATVTSITRAGTTATATYDAAHGLNSGDIEVFSGAGQSEYNISAEVTVLTTTTLTFEVIGAPATPATGTIIATSAEAVYAKYSVVYQGRVWIFNVKTGSDDNPHLIAASEFENPLNFDTTTRSQDSGFSTGNEPFYMLTKDLKAINGVTVFMDRLILSTEKGQLFELTGNDSTDYAWTEFYQGSAATGTESMANIGNDVIFMREGGNIELLSSTQNFGDVSADDVSRWIPDTVRDIKESQIIYDKSNQKVFFFVENKVLVLFKDILNGKQGSPWSIYETELSFKFNVGSALYMRRPQEDVWTVYIGDSSGNIYDLNGVGQGDIGTTNIVTDRQNQIIETDPEQRFMPNVGMLVGRIQYRMNEDVTLLLSFDWTDELNTSTATVVLSGVPSTDVAPYYNKATYYGTTQYYSQTPVYLDKVATKSFSPTGKAKSFFMTASVTSKVKFKVDSIDLVT